MIDEAHRLNEKSGLFYKGENQIKELINAAYVSVFFIDEDQIVTAKDIGSIREIKKWAKILNSKIIDGEDYKLKSQFRCRGSEGYIAFLDHILGIRKPPITTVLNTNMISGFLTVQTNCGKRCAKK